MKYVRKLTPIYSYDIPGLESWLEEQAAKGLYLKQYGAQICTFTRDIPPHGPLPSGLLQYRPGS